MLRPRRLEDVDAITAACQDPEIPRGTLVPSPYTRADAETYLSESAEKEAAGMGLDREPGYGELGYWVAAEARGRGVATRAVRLLSDWAVRELGLERLEILVHQDNAPSRRVAEKAGYRDTGELRALPRGDSDEAVYAVYVLGA